MRASIHVMTAGAAAMLAACAAPGSWQGAAAEKIYDQNLEAIRATAVLNNDDYYELHQDGRIYVIADAGDLKQFLDNGELPLRVTRIGGGPQGETLVFGIAKPEAKKKDGFGSVEMYDGRRQGSDKGFYAEVLKDSKYYVFGSWAELDAFRKSGSASGLTPAGASAKGEAVAIAQPLDVLSERFKSIHGSGVVAAVPAQEAAKEAPAAQPAAAPKARKKARQ